MVESHNIWLFGGDRTRASGNANALRFSLSNEQYKILSHHFRIKLVSASIPFTQPVFRAGLQTLTVTEQGVGTFTITIPEGTWDVDAFVAIVEDLLNTNTLGAYVYTVSYYPGTLRLRIQSTGAFTLDFTASSANMRQVFGFPESATTVDSVGDEINAPLVVRLDGPPFVFIRLNTTHDSNIISCYASSGVIARVPLDATYGKIVHYTEPFDTGYFTGSSHMLHHMLIEILNPDCTPFEIGSSDYPSYHFIFEPVNA